jgi:hypothetical protein
MVEKMMEEKEKVAKRKKLSKHFYVQGYNCLACDKCISLRDVLRVLIHSKRVPVF